MIEDTQLTLLCRSLGVVIFLLVAVYHYVTADVKQE